jgi:hypothetical protein
MKILGKEYNIIMVSDYNLLTDKLGLIDYATNTIYLKDNPNEEIMKETLLHEVIHGIEFALGLNLTEQQVTALSSGLYAVVKENGSDITFDFK